MFQANYKKIKFEKHIRIAKNVVLNQFMQGLKFDVRQFGLLVFFLFYICTHVAILNQNATINK